jgi:hypothetical protein
LNRLFPEGDPAIFHHHHPVGASFLFSSFSGSLTCDHRDDFQTSPSEQAGSPLCALNIRPIHYHGDLYREPDLWGSGRIPQLTAYEKV